MNAATCAIEIRQAVRTRITELGITYETVDEVAGFPARYTGKLLAEPPLRNLSLDSMFALLGAIALTPQLTHDEKRLEKLQKRMEWARRRREGPQYQPKVRSEATYRPIVITLNPDFLRQMGALGGAKRWAKVSKEKRSAMMRKLVKRRWDQRKSA